MSISYDGNHYSTNAIYKIYEEITSYPLDVVYPDVKRPRVEGQSRTEGTWSRDLGMTKRAEATRVSTRRGVAKDSLVTEGVSRPPNSTNRTLKTILSPTKPNLHSPLKTVLNTTKKYTERQQDIHQPQINIL